VAPRFEIIGPISNVETFASGTAIREIARLRRVYGRGRLPDGSIHKAELHCYEASGIGRREFKIKYLL
jgi:hypothetical protein